MADGRRKWVRNWVDALANVVVSPGVILLMALPSIGYGDGTAPRITAETVVRYLQQDLFIAPGIGFNRVKIGQTFDEVRRAWGTPNQTSGGGVGRGPDSSDPGGTIRWVYLAGEDSKIALSGKARVQTIRVQGSLNSPFSSREGAGFGMTPHQIISIYGTSAANNNLSRISYPEKGIALEFEKGAMKVIEVFKPGSDSASDSRDTTLK